MVIDETFPWFVQKETKYYICSSKFNKKWIKENKDKHLLICFPGAYFYTSFIERIKKTLLAKYAKKYFNTCMYHIDQSLTFTKKSHKSWSFIFNRSFAKNFSFVVTYCYEDSLKYKIPLIDPVFEDKFAGGGERKWDSVLITSVATDGARKQSLIDIFSNPKWNQINHFFYANDVNGFLNKERIICEQKPTSCKDYFPCTNCVVYLRNDLKYLTGTITFCIKNQIKILTDCEYSYNLINDKENTRLVKDWKNISEDDILWCKEKIKRDYNESAKDLIDNDIFAKKLIEIGKTFSGKK